MAKTVKIPEYATRLEITINSKTYVYKGGTTVSVPDEVAELLSANAAEAPSGVRATSEAKNAGLLPDGSEDAVPVYTDGNGYMKVTDTNMTRVIHFEGSGEDYSADTSWNKAFSMTLKGKAVFGMLGGAVLPLQAASSSSVVFQGAYTDTTDGTMTVVTVEWSKAGGITVTEKVYDLTEHQEEAGE